MQAEIQQPSEKAAPEKSTKKPKLTPAEKKAKKLELRRLKAITALEAKKNAFRAHLARELKYSKLTHEKASLDWLNLCGDAKLPELQTEVEAAFQHVQHVLDTKNHTIENLLDQLDIANDQYKTNLQQHCQQIEKLIRIYNFFLKSMRTVYDSECYLIVNAFHKETFEKQKVLDSHKVYYENVLHETNSDTSKELDEVFESFIFKKDEKINLSIDYRFKLRDNAIEVMNELYKQMLAVNDVMKMNSASPQRQQIYKRLCTKQQMADIEFASMEENAMKTQIKINKLQKILLEIETTQQQKILDLKHERSYFVECYWILKTKALSDFKKDDEQIKLLAASTHTTVNQLKKIKRYGELIISLTAICRKLQTQKEKVMPWPEGTQPDDTEYSDDLSHLNLMELFWYKVSLAKTHNIALKKEKEKLLEEKGMLKEYLKSYCHGKTIEIMTNILNIKESSTVIIPVQEAAHSRQMQNIKIHKK